jgi:hypothetical protein
MARRRTRQTSPSAGINPVPITNSNISARMPCTHNDQAGLLNSEEQKNIYTITEGKKNGCIQTDNQTLE